MLYYNNAGRAMRGDLPMDETSRNLDAMTIGDLVNGYSGSQSEDERIQQAYDFRQSQPQNASYLRNNTTGAVYSLPTGQRPQQVAQAAQYDPIGELITFGRVNNVSPEKMQQLVKYQANAAPGMPDAMNLYQESWSKNIPLDLMIGAYSAQADTAAKQRASQLTNEQTGLEIQGKNLSNQKSALELRELMTTGGAKPLTEFQGKAAGYGARAGAASDIIDMIGQGGQVQPGMIKRMAESIPMIGESLGTALNWTQSPKEQQIEQAQRDFVNAVLRQESGAAISPGEFENAKRQYFPQPGDSPDVIQQKQRNRELAVSGFATSSGKGGQPLINQARTGARQALSVQLIKDAQTAISRGANPAAVKSRLEKIGIDTSGL